MPTARSSATFLVMMLSVGVGCREDRSAGVGEDPPAWTTEDEYRFGDSADDELFFTAPEVRTDPARGRIFAVDRPNHQVGVFTPDGTLLFRVGRKGEGPGEFINIGSLHIEPDGAFAVQEAERGRYARFTADGELVGTTPGPPAALSYQGLPVNLHWPAGSSYLGTLFIPNELEVGWGGLAPVTRMPVVRVRGLGNGQWSDPEPLLWVDISNRIHYKVLPGDGAGDTTFVTGSQPFGDPDQLQFEPGTVVVLRSKGKPGTVEIIEVEVGGDTIWHRRVELGVPRRLTSAMVDDAAEGWVTALLARSSRHTPARLRKSYYDGLHQPEYMPPSEGPPILTASTEVWIRTPELLDTLRVYYAVPRGDSIGLPRRVLVPESLWVTDATRTHVWGARWDELGRPHIVGRRLVPPST